MVVGGLAQPAARAAAINRNSNARLITEADSEYIYIRLPQPRALLVQQVEVARRADANAMIGIVFNRHPLDGRLYALQCQLGPAPIGILIGTERPRLQDIKSWRFDGARRNVPTDIGLFFVDDHFEIRQHRVEVEA